MTGEADPFLSLFPAPKDQAWKAQEIKFLSHGITMTVQEKDAVFYAGRCAEELRAGSALARRALPARVQSLLPCRFRRGRTPSLHTEVCVHATTLVL